MKDQSVYEAAYKEFQTNGRELFAVNILESMLDKDPRDWEAWLLYGRTLEKLSRYSDSKNALLRAQKLADECNQPVVSAYLGQLFQRICPIEAKYWFEKATNNSNATWSWPWVFKGTNLLTLGQFDDALDCFQFVVNNELDDAEEAYLNIAITKIAKGNYLEATESLQRALEIDADYVGARKMLSGIKYLDKLSQFDTAKRSEIIKASKDFLGRPGFAVCAVSILSKLISQNENHSASWFWYGQALHQIYRYEDSKQAFLTGLNISPEEFVPSFYANIAHVFEEKNPLEAKKWYEKSTVIAEQTEDWFWLFKGKNLIVLGEFTDAINCLIQGKNRFPETREELEFQLGIANRAAGNLTAAKQAFEKVLSINSKNAEAKSLLSGLLAYPDIS